MIETALWTGLPLAATAGVAAWGAYHPAAQLYGPVVRRLPANGGRPRMALTFDDGPNPRITPRLLDLLEKHGARATFFLVGRFVRECPEVTREIAARGHLLANHTDTHPSLVWLSGGRIRQELRRCEDAIGRAVGAGGKRWMRPPYGARGPQVNGAVREEHLSGVVTWSVICYEWRPQPAGRLIQRLARVRAGDIVVLHDGDHRFLNADRERVIEALAYWLPRWRDAGFEFVTMDAAVGH